MFDISVIPYMVFVVMAIPPFVFGYFKGWRSGVFTLAMTLVVGAAFMGIAFSMYNSIWWPTFKNLFLSYTNNPEHLDVNLLKEIAKPSIVSIVIGAGIVPGIMLSMSIQHFFKNRFSNHMRPSLKTISKNEANIKRRNLKFTRVGGLVINGASGLIVASAAAGAVSTFTVPSYKSNLFQKFSNLIGEGMTFGNGGYDKGFQEMYEFISDAKQYESPIEDLKDVFLLGQDSVGNFAGSNFDLLYKDFKSKDNNAFITKTNEMGQESKEESEALTLLMLGTQSTKDLNLLGVGKSFEEYDKNIEASIKKIEEMTSKETSGIHWNKEGVEMAIKHILANKFIDFKESSYYKNWSQAKTNLDLDNEVLKDRENKLSKDKQNIVSDRATQETLSTSIKNNWILMKDNWNKLIESKIKMGKGYTVETPSIVIKNTEWYTYDDNAVKQTRKISDSQPPVFEDVDLTKYNAGIFEKYNIAMKNEEETKTKLDVAEKNKEYSLEDFNNTQKVFLALQQIKQINNKLNLNKLDLANKIKAKDAAVAKYNKIEKDIDDFTNQLKVCSTKQDTLDKDGDEFKKNADKINELNDQITKSKILLKDADEEKQKASKSYDDANENNVGDLDSLKVLQDSIIDPQKSLKDAESENEVAKQTYEDDLKSFNNISLKYKIQKEAFDNASKEYVLRDKQIKKIINENNVLLEKNSSNFKKIKDLASDLKNNINDRDKLKDDVKNPDSILFEKNEIADIQTKLDKLNEIKIEKEKEYKERIKRITDALTKILT